MPILWLFPILFPFTLPISKDLSRSFFSHVGSRQILHFDIHTNPTT
ncbi:hypothetical protein LEP1GSC038_2420, partial [Leptospira weilii str. 2006001855]